MYVPLPFAFFTVFLFVYDMDSSTLRRGDENRSMTPIKTQRQVRPLSPEPQRPEHEFHLLHVTSASRVEVAVALSSTLVVRFGVAASRFFYGEFEIDFALAVAPKT